MLMNTEIRKNGAESELLAEILAFLSSQIVPLEEQLLIEEEFIAVQMILIFFAKLIKQESVYYNTLNDKFMHVIEMHQDGKLALIFEQSSMMQKQRRSGVSYPGGGRPLEYEAGSHPFLCLMIRALHGLMQVNYEYSRTAICHIMDALSALYSCELTMVKQ